MPAPVQNNITSYPHQKIVHINRDMPKEKEGGFLLIKTQNLFDAYRKLNATATMLYLYLIKNKDGFNLALSKQAVNNEMGMPFSTYDDQVKKLITHRYLVQREDGSNIYDFYERPLESPKEEKKEEVPPTFVF